HLSDNRDRRYVLMWVCAGSAGLALLGFFLSRASENALIALGVLYGGLVFTLYGLAVAHVNDLIDSSRLLEVAGGLLLVHGIGAALGPTIAGTFMDRLGPASLMLFFALVLALLALYAMQRIKAAPGVPEEEKSNFVVMTST